MTAPTEGQTTTEAKPLSPKMQDALRKIGSDWGKLPAEYRLCGHTIRALRRRGLIELRSYASYLQVRLTPTGAKTP